MAKTLIVIAGPTAIGKTSLAIKLAQYYKTEIISADSRQFYREMEIGTAKPSTEELRVAKHYFINSHSVTDNFNVGDYERQALELIARLFNDQDIIIVVGGSGLFINAIVNGFDDLPSSSADTRDKLNYLFKNNGISYLQQQLKEIDPAYYSEVDIKNPQRLIRALEVYEVTGKPFSEFRKKSIKTRPFDIIQLGLNTERDKLYASINKRVDIMISKGLIEEVARLNSYRNLNPLKSVGYSEIFDHLDGKISLEETTELIKQNTRRFAKRQLTWFKKSENIKWFEPHEFESITSFLNSLLKGPEHGVQKS